MARKYTRKQLKQPDEFITLSHKVWIWVSDHATRVLAMVGVAIALIAVAWTWSHLAHRKAEKATALLSRAVEIYNQTVVKDKPAPAKDKTNDDIPRFGSRKAKLEASEKELSTVMSKYGDSTIGQMAQLLRAGVRFDLGHFDTAIADYQNFIKQTDARDEPLLHTEAVEGLVYCYEAQKKWDEALKAVTRMHRQGETRFEALYQEARILAEKGDRKGAVERLKKVRDEADSRALVQSANQQLALLEDA